MTAEPYCTRCGMVQTKDVPRCHHIHGCYQRKRRKAAAHARKLREAYKRKMQRKKQDPET